MDGPVRLAARHELRCGQRRPHARTARRPRLPCGPVRSGRSPAGCPDPAGQRRHVDQEMGRHPRFHACRIEVGGADERRHIAVRGRLVDLVRCSDLRQGALPHHADPARYVHGLVLIVGHHDEGDADTLLDGRQFRLRAFAEIPVQRRHRLVEEQQQRLLDERPRQRDALLLAAGQLVRLAAREGAELDLREHGGDALLDLGARDRLLAQTERHVVEHGEMREERVGLEHHVDRSPVRRHVGHVAAVQEDAPRVGGSQPGNEAQQRGLAATRVAEQAEVFAAADVERDAAHRLDAGEGLRDIVEAQNRRLGSGHLACRALFAHGSSPSPARNSIRQFPCRSKRRRIEAAILILASGFDLPAGNTRGEGPRGEGVPPSMRALRRVLPAHAAMCPTRPCGRRPCGRRLTARWRAGRPPPGGRRQTLHKPK